VTGTHFALHDGGRGVVFARPERLKVEEALRAQTFTVIAAKHGVEVRLANSEETPNLCVKERLPEQRDFDSVEEWPPPAEDDQPVVAEYVGSVGAYLGEGVGDGLDTWLRACDLDVAVEFENAAEAEKYLAQHARQHQVTLRFMSAARAEQDQREMALFDS
jgi:hypothetical protein